MIDKLKIFLSLNPHYIGLFIALVGVVLLIAAIKDANWLFGDVSGVTYSLKKIDGWVNLFGRKTARIIAGVFDVIMILAGLLVFLLGTFFK